MGRNKYGWTIKRQKKNTPTKTQNKNTTTPQKKKKKNPPKFNNKNYVNTYHNCLFLLIIERSV